MNTMTDPIASDLIERLDEYRRAEAYVGEFCATDEQWPDVLEARDEALVALYPHVPAIVEALSQLTREVDELREALHKIADDPYRYGIRVQKMKLIASEALSRSSGRVSDAAE